MRAACGESPARPDDLGGRYRRESQVPGHAACGRLLALNAAIWHNWQIGAPVKRSLIAYDH